jgi:hypothetical protein
MQVYAYLVNCAGVPVTGRRRRCAKKPIPVRPAFDLHADTMMIVSEVVLLARGSVRVGQ